jgi:hypothetical protein
VPFFALCPSTSVSDSTDSTSALSDTSPEIWALSAASELKGVDAGVAVVVLVVIVVVVEVVAEIAVEVVADTAVEVVVDIAVVFAVEAVAVVVLVVVVAVAVVEDVAVVVVVVVVAAAAAAAVVAEGVVSSLTRNGLGGLVVVSESGKMLQASVSE